MKKIIVLIILALLVIALPIAMWYLYHILITTTGFVDAQGESTGLGLGMTLTTFLACIGGMALIIGIATDEFKL